MEEFDLDDFKVPLKEWIQQEQPRVEIKRRFRQFLDHFEDGETRERVHDKVIDAMCAQGGQSLTISYLNLSRFAPTLAIWLADEPAPMLELFDAVAKAVVAARFPDWYNPVRVRVCDLPIPDSLRDLRQVHLGVLVRVQGVVTRRTGVMPQLSLVRFNCNACGALSEPIQQTGAHEARMVSCPVCPPDAGRASGTVNSEATLYRNFQRLTLQESPGSVPAGRVPRSKEVILCGDLVDCARPGEEVDVTGIYTHQFDASLNARNGFPVFGTVIEANYVKRLSDNSAHLNITEQDRAEFDKLSKDPNIVRRLVRSLAPSIYGNDRAKLAVALAMFGGREKNVKNKHRIRGDINVLLLGDPGVAKSQILKYVEKTATRCVYTTGKGASAVGLTAAVSKDPITGEWTLEGGALVLADRGVCCIDEFDKMTDQDRTSIHEAMEQQSISISKAGIVTTLQARCAVVAAANPIGGRYDSSKTFSENVQLTDPILTRFDVLCVLRDEVDPVLDGKLAEFVVRSHVRSHPEIKLAMEALGSLREDEVFQVKEGMQPILAAAQESMTMSSLDEGASAVGGDGSALEPIPQDLLRKYIVHARALKPSLTNIDQNKVAELYMSLRRESEVSNGVPVAVRHIESIMRISEAAARMRLSNMVSDSDLNLAIRTTMESFIAAQKAGVQVRGVQSRGARCPRPPPPPSFPPLSSLTAHSPTQHPHPHPRLTLAAHPAAPVSALPADRHQQQRAAAGQAAGAGAQAQGAGRGHGPGGGASGDHQEGVPGRCARARHHRAGRVPALRPVSERGLHVGRSGGQDPHWLGAWSSGGGERGGRAGGGVFVWRAWCCSWGCAAGAVVVVVHRENLFLDS